MTRWLADFVPHHARSFAPLRARKCRQPRAFRLWQIAKGGDPPRSVRAVGVETACDSSCCRASALANGFLLTAGMPVGKAQVHDGAIQLSVTASGLGTGCEGHKLCGVVRVRVTTHRCPMSPCTTTDLELTNLSDTACCTVTNGNCKLKTSINTEVFDALRLGQRAGIELLGCGLRRRDGPTPPTGLTFACGMLAP